MGTRVRRHFSAAQKYQILREGREAGASIAEVCRRHQIAASQYYDWERLAQTGALSALANGRHGKRKDVGVEQELMAELARLREVIAELSAENLAWKKGRC